MKKSFLSRPAALAPAPRAITALMLREMATFYGRSPGGYIWAIAEPIAAIALMSLAFSVAFDAPLLGRSFVLFYATGYLPYMMVQDVSSKIGQAIRFSRPLFAYPAITLADALIARWALNVVTHVAVFALILCGIEAIYVTGALYRLDVIVSALAMATALAFGIGTLNAALIAFVPVWERVWQIGTRPLFVISGIFFLMEILPAELRSAAWWNPLIHVTAEMRHGTYANYEAGFVSAPYVYAVALASACLGFLIFRAMRWDVGQT
ncbi:MAG: ABC transporter permease [Pseudomonadota bacterium]